MSNTILRQVAPVARAFARRLREQLTSEEMATVLERNRMALQRGDTLVCHSHDFCDANMVMDAAIKEVYGKVREPFKTDLFNAAWELAKCVRFEVERMGTPDTEPLNAPGERRKLSQFSLDLRQWRTERDMTQQEAADWWQIPLGQWRRWENGGSQPPEYVQGLLRRLLADRRQGPRTREPNPAAVRYQNLCSGLEAMSKAKRNPEVQP